MTDKSIFYSVCQIYTELIVTLIKMFCKMFHFCLQYINVHSSIYIQTMAACNLLNYKCDLLKCFLHPKMETSLLAFLKSLSEA